VDPISGYPAAQPSLRRFGRLRPGGRLQHGVDGARASHPTVWIVAGGVGALAVMALVGLWTRAGLGSSSIVPSTVIAALALAAVASTYRLEHRPRPALVDSGDLRSPAATVRALAQANAAHMAGVSHIRILDADAVAVAVATRAERTAS
jgi:hypothetical protein